MTQPTRSFEDRARKIREQEKATERQNARLKADMKRWEDRRKIIIGATILNAIQTDKELAATVQTLLRKAVTREADQKHIMDLLAGESLGVKLEPEGAPA